VFEDMGLAMAITSKGGEMETEGETMNGMSPEVGTGTGSFVRFSGVRLSFALPPPSPLAAPLALTPPQVSSPTSWIHNHHSSVSGILSY
jgi:hypothetical protein